MMIERFSERYNIFNGYCLDDYDNVDKVKALIIHLDYWKHRDGEIEQGKEESRFDVGNAEYLVLTDEEADDCAREYLDDEEHWKTAVANGDTELGKEEWIEYVIKSDGRGSIISSYDGSEEEQNIHGETYYIYRIN